MKLPTPPSRYDPTVETRRNNILELELARALRRDTDAELGGGRLVLTAPNGTRWALSVSNAGVLSAVAL